MKKLAIFLLMSALTTFFLYSQVNKTTITASITISGNVVKILELRPEITREISLDVLNTQMANLGRIVVFSNNETGWTITISSENGGKLTGAGSDNTDAYEYMLQFGNGDYFSLSNNMVFDVAGQTSGEGASYDLSLRFLSYDELVNPVASDVYSDTITISISAS